MKCNFDKQVFLSRVPEGPLAAHIGAFAGSLHEQGYAPRSIRRHVLLASCFNGWLKHKGIAVCSITPEQPAQYLRYRSRQVRLWPEDASALSKLLCFLQCEGIIPAKRVIAHQPTPVERCIRAYERHLREHAVWPKQRFSSTCRLSALFSRIVSGMGPSRSHAYAPAMS